MSTVVASELLTGQTITVEGVDRLVTEVDVLEPMSAGTEPAPIDVPTFVRIRTADASSEILVAPGTPMTVVD